jgi:hypothetical protein
MRVAMEKIIVVYEQLPRAAAADRFIEVLDSGVAPHCHAVTLHLGSEAFAGDFITAGGFDETLTCALSLWVDRVETGLRKCDPALAMLGSLYSVYSVVESVPREYPRIDWAAAQASPGVTLLALMKRHPALSREAFFERWYNHTEISLRIHPLTRYHRNAVLRKVAGNGADWDGIVEERVGDVEDMRPERFYIGENVEAMTVADLLAFVDVPNGGMRCGLLREYIVKKPAWL